MIKSDSDWYRALTLNERITSLQLDHKRSKNLTNHNVPSNHKINRWKSQSPFDKENYFAQRLDAANITEADLDYFLNESTEVFKTRCFDPPDWSLEIIQAFDNNFSAHFLLLDNLEEPGVAGFLYLIKPLIEQAIEQLNCRIKSLIHSHNKIPFEVEKFIALLSEELPSSLGSLISKTLVLELNVARLQKLLRGENSEERFRHFVEGLQQKDIAISLLQEYPVLARQVLIHLENWVNFSLEFIRHLVADYQDLKVIFNSGESLGDLVELQWNAGDSHRQGRSVLIAKFSSGLKLVYKPRSLAVDVHFQELLNWLNERGNHPPFHRLKILDRSSYGWVEFISPNACNSPDELQRFYESQGGYLALLYALKATDFHSENLIASGEHPILVDLESLFHPHFAQSNFSKSEIIAAKKLNYSVLSVGLLPQRIWFGESEGIEVSGLSGKEGQLTPDHIPYWEGKGTDEMHLKRERMEMPGDNNRPRLKGEAVEVTDYLDFLLKGFTNIYQLLLQHQEELLSENSPISRFANDEVRVVLRSTRSYELLLNESWHPDLLRDALERDRFFDHLWIDVQYIPTLATVIPYEQEDLWQGDIPVFHTRPNSRHLWSSSKQLIPDFLEETGLDLAYRCLKNLSQEDLDQQLWIIRAAMLTLVSNHDKKPQWANYSLSEPSQKASQKLLLKAASDIGDRLSFLCLKEEEDVAWIGVTYPDDENAALAPVGIDLYDGLPGIALFLAYLGTLTQQQKYTNLARSTLKAIQDFTQANRSRISRIGGFDGWGAIIYTLTNLGVLWNEPELLTEAENLVKLLPDLITQDKLFDIIGGVAGCLASLISLYRCQPSSTTLDAAIHCGNYLVSQAQTMEQGVAWLPKGSPNKPLAGFSHGVAGIAWALLELATLTGEERYKTTAVAGIAYERSLFRPEVGNWPDLRNFSDAVLSGQEAHCMTAWCHGAPGIGLARLHSLCHLDDEQIRSEINTALQTTLNHGFGDNHCLCHGDLGNLDFLLQASLILDEPQLKTQVDYLSAIILESINQHGWLCGLPLQVENPGLMTGLAGIGYGLLRLAAPDKIPSVLILEPLKINHDF